MKQNVALTKGILLNLLLSLISILVVLTCLELGMRAYEHVWSVYNFTGIGEEFDQLRGNIPQTDYPWIFDTHLGWIPKPLTTVNIPGWNDARVTILEDGIRANGNETVLSQDVKNAPVLLTVGDSFTFGDQVADHETWPAILETLIQGKVYNAGVFGYGMDQAFLRAKRLIDRYHPDILIFSLIPQDIHRCEFAVSYGIPKPYFNIDTTGRLTLMDSHISPPEPHAQKLDLFRRIFGYSLLVHTIMLRVSPTYWYTGRWNLRVHRNGDAIACSLVKQLQQLAQETHITVVILIQYDTFDVPVYLSQAEHLLRCIDPRSLYVLDLKTALSSVRDYDRERFESFFNWHMTRQGNEFVAKQLSMFMKTLKLIPDE